MEENLKDRLFNKKAVSHALALLHSLVGKW